MSDTEPLHPEPFPDPVSHPVSELALAQEESPAQVATTAVSGTSPEEPAETRFLKWVMFGSQGLRVGWSVGLFFVLTFLFIALLGTAVQAIRHNVLHVKPGPFNAFSNITQESVQLICLLGAAAICARIERRRIVDYNLSGPNRMLHFAVGLVGGFVALSALIAALYYGGWLKFGAVELSGAAILQFGVLWGIGFLLTGLGEEGMVRCYMQYTLTRGINYWWALGSVTLMWLICFLFQHGEGRYGIYAMAGLGVLPCLWLHLKKSPGAGFWQAAWLTSTFFGFIHTGNDGETWIGIFSAAAIGFAFCVSIRVTGSAWWAIGYHAAWDWAQTFFYGTADSGLQPKGHYLTSNPVGPELWSGGTDGPEGSLLVIPVVLLTILVLLVAYRRRPEIGVETASTPGQPQLS